MPDLVDAISALIDAKIAHALAVAEPYGSIGTVSKAGQAVEAAEKALRDALGSVVVIIPKGAQLVESSLRVTGVEI